MTAQQPLQPVNARNPTIDILRGIAIFTMVAANLSAPLLHPDDKTLPFRLYGTFAAPLFIMLAGMMVVITQARHTGLWHYLQRGLLIIACGCLLDTAIWQIYPLLGYDVLYLTGLAIPLVYLLARYCGIHARLFITGLLVLASPLLQQLFGYREELPSFELGSLSFTEYLNLLFSADTGQRLLLDGWFPLLPWLGFAILGSVLGSCYSQGYSLASKSLLAYALSLLTAGIALWLLQQPNLVIRDGYSELFYPPTVAYFCTAAGLILLGFYLVENTRQLPVHGLFLKLGHASLFMYILHQALLAFALMPVVELNRQPLNRFLLTYSLTIGALIAIGHTLLAFKQKYKKMPFLVRFLIGS